MKTYHITSYNYTQYTHTHTHIGNKWAPPYNWRFVIVFTTFDELQSSWAPNLIPKHWTWPQNIPDIEKHNIRTQWKFHPSFIDPIFRSGVKSLPFTRKPAPPPTSWLPFFVWPWRPQSGRGEARHKNAAEQSCWDPSLRMGTGQQLGSQFKKAGAPVSEVGHNQDITR